MKKSSSRIASLGGLIAILAAVACLSSAASADDDAVGPEAGVSLGGDDRYVWNENINSQNSAYPFGQNFGDGGFMLTTALNHRF